MKKLILLLSLSVLLFSCKKDNDNDEPAQVTPTVANLTGSWKITAATANNVNVFDNSNASLNLFEPCERDDIYRLNANYTLDLIDAGVKCNPPTDDTGTWELINATTFKIDAEVFTINSYNGSKLVLSRTDAGFTVVVTFTKQ